MHQAKRSQSYLIRFWSIVCTCLYTHCTHNTNLLLNLVLKNCKFNLHNTFGCYDGTWIYNCTKFITVYSEDRLLLSFAKVLEILMQRIAFCSLAVPTLAGWVTTSVPGSWIRAHRNVKKIKISFDEFIPLAFRAFGVAMVSISSAQER